MAESDDAVPAEISSLLREDEKLIWWGRPRQGLMLTRRDALLIPFSVLWGGFAVFWEVVVIKTGNTLFALWGVPFILMGLFFIFGRFLADAWVRRYIIYGLTDRRVLIGRFGRWPSFTSISLDRLPETTLTEISGGRGTIRFGTQGPLWANRNFAPGGWCPALDQTSQFIGIEEPDQVYTAVQERSRRSV